jgi:glutathione reductase (NADPH)
VSRHFDALVVGSGTSAAYVLNGLLAAGKKVAVVDERPFGGTCALRGCQPKKYLVANAEAVAQARDLLGRGMAQAPVPDWKAMQALKAEFLRGRPEAEFEDWKEAGATPIRGAARMTGRQEVTVDGEVLTADHIVLATGSRSRRSGIPGSEHMGTSDDFLDLPEMPRRIVFLGGGYISFEFAHVAARQGASVQVLDRSERPLKLFDADMVRVVCEAGEEVGIHFVPGESATSVEKTPDGLVLHGSSGTTYEADAIFEAIGRVPNLSVLEGEAGDVESSPRGIAVNEYLQSTTNPHVFAVGDCAASGAMLATVADEQGKVVARNIVEGISHRPQSVPFPSTAFTIPNIASVGLSEEQALAEGRDYRVSQGTTTGWPSSKRIGEDHSAYKILIDRQDDTLLGAHLARHHAAETINLFALAVQHGITATTLANTLWAYPTMASDIKMMVR